MCWEKWESSKVVLVPIFTRYNIVPTMNLPNQFSLLTEIEYYKRDNIRNIRENFCQ